MLHITHVGSGLVLILWLDRQYPTQSVTSLIRSCEKQCCPLPINYSLGISDRDRFTPIREQKTLGPILNRVV